MDDEDKLHRFGTALPALVEDDVPAKKPIYAEDQIVTDENGRRRFHGAFTGGFSAGFWNTVGSLHGWTPQTFKSSRNEKAPQAKQARPEDFMDEEDLGEFGIAPQRIQASYDFSKDGQKHAAKRKFLQESAGPIPGTPVLAMLLNPVKDKAAVRILKSMGWRPGQGVGPRQTRKQKKAANVRNKRELYIWQRYCDDEDMPQNKKPPTKQSAASTDESGADDDEDDDDDDDEITFAPTDIEPLFLKSKTDTFGFGYTGLTGTSASVSTSTQLQRINLFEPLEVVGKNNKKLSIAGQAFGVGALEEEDEDIYARDDMTKYDFSLEEKTQKQKVAEKKVLERGVIAGFEKDASMPLLKTPYCVDMPANFKPRNWALRKSRFEPLNDERQKELMQELKQHAVGRHNLDAEKRGQLLGEERLPAATNAASEELPVTSKLASNKSIEQRVDKSKELLARITAKSNNFTKGGLITSDGAELTLEQRKANEDEEAERKNLLEIAANKTKAMGKPAGLGEFKPFINNEPKQERYEQFLETKLTAEAEVAEFLRKLQPLHMSEWDRAMEVKEFLQARNIYKPLGGLMSDRFVSEAKISAEKVVKEAEKQSDRTIVMERTKCMWKPHALLCKRYNIAEPFGGAMHEEQKTNERKPKVSVFDYLEVSVNKKENFQTPVIIPKHIEKPKPIVSSTAELKPTGQVIEPDKQQPDKIASKPTPAKLPAQSSATVVSKTATYVPKTELEKSLEANKNKPLWEKTELYKAIFEDSDDDANEAATKPTDNAKADGEVQQEAAAATMPAAKPLNAAAANLLRNDSPPRGIFAALFSKPVTPDTLTPATSNATSSTELTKDKQPTKIIFQSRNERQQRLEDSEHLDSTSTSAYGPSLPKALLQKTSNQSTAEAELEQKLSVLLHQHKHVAATKMSEWVERAIGTSDDDSSSSSGSSSSSVSSATKKSKKKRKHKRAEKKHKKKDSKKKKKHEKQHKSKKKKKK